MAIDQQPMSRQITLPATNVTTGTGFTQLANATAQISNLVTERLNDVAISQAATQGESDVQNERQPNKLALPLNKATKAYNNAVTDTEARRMAQSADELINESLARNKNPATFTRDTPAKFNAELEGIKSGILQHTRDENREKVREHLDKISAHASLDMLKHSMEFDNAQTNFEFKQEMIQLYDQRRDAVIAGNNQRVAGIDEQMDKVLSDYSAMSAVIARMAPYYQKDIAKQKQIDAVYGGYAQALHEKTTPKFLADLAENKQNLPFNVWQEAVKGVVALDQTEKRLNNDMNAQQVAQVELGIQNGTIQNEEDLLNYDITIPQQLSAMKALNKKQAELMKQGAQYITAQQNILTDRGTWNSADTRNKMFQAQINNMEQATGKPATLQDMAQSVLGQSQYPASGMTGIGMGANVPAFDAAMSQKLTSKDPMMTAQAAMIYNNMVNTQGKPNSINLTGDALAVATLFNEINTGGTTPDQAAMQAIDTVLNAKEPEIAQRIERFHKTLEKTNPQTGQQDVMRSKFKDAFGLAPQAFGSDQAFRVFKDTYRANYLSSNSEESAFNATKYAMRAWGTSTYFDKGYVGQPVPEKEVPITNIGHAFPNQIVSNIQGLINRTNAAREANPGLNIPVIEWADPKQTITGTESEQDKVFKRMTLGSHPRIKINGHETDVVLIPSGTSRLGEGVNYLLGTYDQFNNLNPLKDVSNSVDQVARFSPKELSVWAPSVASDQTDKDLRSVALKIQQKEAQSVDKKDLEELDSQNPAWQVILGLASTDDYRQYIEKRKSQSNEGRLDTIVNALKGNSATVRDDITDADNVGVSMDLEPRR